MKSDYWPADVPREGFLKVEGGKKEDLCPSDKAALIRKGNECFNAGNYQLAKRIFITTGYSDGLTRIGDYYMEQREPLEALKMYALAPAPDRMEEISVKIALIIRNLLKS